MKVLLQLCELHVVPWVSQESLINDFLNEKGAWLILIGKNRISRFFSWVSRYFSFIRGWQVWRTQSILGDMGSLKWIFAVVINQLWSINQSVIDWLIDWLSGKLLHCGVLIKSLLHLVLTCRRSCLVNGL